MKFDQINQRYSLRNHLLGFPASESQYKLPASMSELLQDSPRQSTLAYIQDNQFSCMCIILFHKEFWGKMQLQWINCMKRFGVHSWSILNETKTLSPRFYLPFLASGTSIYSFLWLNLKTRKQWENTAHSVGKRFSQCCGKHFDNIDMDMK